SPPPPHSFPTRRSSDLPPRGKGLPRPAPLGLAVGHTAALLRGSTRRPVEGTPTGPARAREIPRGDPRLRNRRRPRPPLPQSQCRSEEHTSELQSRGHLV